MTRPVSAITPAGTPCIVYADRIEIPYRTRGKRAHRVLGLQELAIRGWLSWHAAEVRRAT